MKKIVLLLSVVFVFSSFNKPKASATTYIEESISSCTQFAIDMVSIDDMLSDWTMTDFEMIESLEYYESLCENWGDGNGQDIVILDTVIIN